MKRLINYPFLWLTFFQSIVLLLLFVDVLFLATAIKLLLLSVAGYSALIATYSKEITTKRVQLVLWSLAGIIFSLITLKLWDKTLYPWSFVLFVMLFQVQLFVFVWIKRKTTRILSTVLGCSIFGVLFLMESNTITLSINWMILLLGIYSLLLISEVFIKFKKYV